MEHCKVCNMTADHLLGCEIDGCPVVRHRPSRSPSSTLPTEVQVAYEKANEAACCGCSQTVQIGPNEMGQECCGNPVPLALIDEAVARDLGVAVFKHWETLFASSETACSEGYPGIAHDLETMRTALHEMERAALRMAQCWNLAGDKHSEGVSSAEVDAARQGVDVARKRALAVLKPKTALNPAAAWPFPIPREREGV